MRVTGSTCWVPPFGNPWIIAYLQLPKAYRRLSRPSSAPSAKASTVRPFYLDLASKTHGPHGPYVKFWFDVLMNLQFSRNNRGTNPQN